MIRVRPVDLLRFFSLFALCAWILGCATLCPPPGREAAGNAAGAVTSAASNAPAAAATSPAREKLRADLNTIFSDPRFDNAFWGVRVETAEGEVIYDLNGAKSMNPASNTKLVTTAAALDRLGKDFSYTTRVDAVGEIRNGRLDGDLVIVGSGDPSLGAWHPDDSHDSAKLLAEWAKALKDAGIREISGDIIGDGRCFTEEYISSYWEYGDLPYWYGCGSSGLAMEENCFRFYTTPGKAVGDRPSLRVVPATPFITLVNEATTATTGTKTTADIVSRETGSNVFVVRGEIAIDAKPHRERGAVWDGALYAATLAKEAFEREGIRVDGAARNIRSLGDPARIDKPAPGRRQTFITHVSPPLSELIRVVNKPSHNFFADQILRTLAVHEGFPGDFDGGLKAVRKWFEAIGAPDPDKLQMCDGSGLARQDYVQPRQFCALLRRIYNNPELRDVFRTSLPYVGEESTLDKRMVGTAAEGKVQAKTGYIGYVRGFSGYVTDASGRDLVFSMLVNNHNAGIDGADEVIDRACVTLASFRE